VSGEKRGYLLNNQTTSINSINMKKIYNVLLSIIISTFMCSAQTIPLNLDARIANRETLDKESNKYREEGAFINRLKLALENALGENWRDIWTTEGATNDDDLIDFYLSGNDIIVKYGPIDSTFSTSKRQELVNYIATKPNVTLKDATNYRTAGFYDERVFNRVVEFAALSESTSTKNENYFKLKHQNLGFSKSYAEVMTIEEWFDLASAAAPISTEAYNFMRTSILSAVAQGIINKRAEEKIDIKSEEFNTLVADVRTALASPLFEGLKEAIDALEIGLVIPESVSFADQIAVANNAKTSIERKFDGVNTQTILGSIMFVLGEAGYDEWRDAIITPQ